MVARGDDRDLRMPVFIACVNEGDGMILGYKRA
jgi:hypothetical protein